MFARSVFLGFCELNERKEINFVGNKYEKGQKNVLFDVKIFPPDF